MKTKSILSAVFVAVILVFNSSAVLAAEAENNERIQIKNRLTEQHQQIHQAVLSGDFSTWYKLLSENFGNSGILEIITEDKFARFSEAVKTLDELGLKCPMIRSGAGERVMNQKMLNKKLMNKEMKQMRIQQFKSE